MTRAPLLQSFLLKSRAVLAARNLGGPATAAVARIEAALATPARPGPGSAQRLPVCDHLPEALGTARMTADLAGLVDALTAIAPALRWAPRSAGGPNASANWPGSHANATIVGPGGLEQRDDVHIGASLLGPHVRYPDHNHGPEEVYLVLSPGRFQHGTSGWFEPGIGGTLYNEPDIRHAMASDGAPLLALWYLWTGAPGPS